MSDRPEDAPLTPAEDERIRRLLAEARHTEPMPERMVERFDRVLAGLAADPADGQADELADGADGHVAVVIDLASRRRRTAATLLVAAAAVIVAGVGIGQILPDNAGSQNAADTATSAQDNAAAGGDAGAPKQQESSSAAVAPTVPSPESAPGRLAVVRIRSAHFGADVRKARAGAMTAGDPAALTGDFAAPACPADAYGDGLVVGATYDGAPAALVLRQPAGDVQVVDLYLCGTTEPTRSITLTYP